MTARPPAHGRELLNYPAFSGTVVTGWHVISFGLAMLGVCVFAVQIWMGRILGNANAPLWVIGMVGVTFGIAGLLLVIYGVGDLRRESRSRVMAQTHPDDPWRADHDWSSAMSSGGMRSRDSARWWVHIFGLAILIAMASISNWLAFDTWGTGVEGWFLLAMAVLTDLIVLLVVGLAVRRAMMRVRYGSPRVVFERVPVGPGAVLRARVVARGLGGCERIELTLREVAERYSERKTGHGKPKRAVECRELRALVRTIEDVASEIGTGGAVPVEFVVPEDAQPNEIAARPARFWDLEVRGVARGVDFVHRFVVPVYGG